MEWRKTNYIVELIKYILKLFHVLMFRFNVKKRIHKNTNEICCFVIEVIHLLKDLIHEKIKMKELKFIIETIKLCF